MSKHQVPEGKKQRPHNVPDEILLRLKKNGGLIMIDMVAEHSTTAFGKWAEAGDSVYYSIKEKFPGDKVKLKEVMMQWEKDYPMPVVTIADVANHFDYVKKLMIEWRVRCAQ